MAHFAEIDSNNIVIRVIVIPNDQEHRSQEYIANDLGLGGTWIQTSYNTRDGEHIKGGTPLRKNYAGVGFTYDATRDAFIPKKNYPSWILNEERCKWLPPTPHPADGKKYVWNESIVGWTAYPENPTGPYAWSEITYSWIFKPQDGQQYKWNKQTYTWDTV